MKPAVADRGKASQSMVLRLDTGPATQVMGAASTPNSGIEVFWARLTPDG